MVENKEALSNTEYIDRAALIHYKLLIMQPFIDGNKRTSRAFLNWLLVKKGLPPFIISDEEYENCLNSIVNAQNAEKKLESKGIDATNNMAIYKDLYHVIFRCVGNSINRISKN